MLGRRGEIALGDGVVLRGVEAHDVAVLERDGGARAPEVEVAAAEPLPLGSDVDADQQAVGGVPRVRVGCFDVVAVWTYDDDLSIPHGTIRAESRPRLRSP